MIQSADINQKFQSKPCWSWSGADKLSFSEQTKDLEQLVATLPVKRSANDQILAFLVDLRARFRRWLHQDEFGPTRRQQIAGLRALKKSLQTLQRHLARGARSQREKLDVMLRSGSDNPATTLERIYEAAVDLGHYLRSDAPKRKIDWALKIQAGAEKIMVQSQSLDTNADGEILLIAIRQNFDPLQACPVDFGLAGAEQWLYSYWKLVDEALCALNERGGAEERVSLKLLVEELCKLWECETGRPVTAHGMSKLKIPSDPKLKPVGLLLQQLRQCSLSKLGSMTIVSFPTQPVLELFCPPSSTIERGKYS